MKFLQSIVNHSLQPARHAQAGTPPLAPQAFEPTGQPAPMGQPMGPEQEAEDLHGVEPAIESAKAPGVSPSRLGQQTDPEEEAGASPARHAGKAADTELPATQQRGPAIPDLLRPPPAGAAAVPTPGQRTASGPGKVRPEAAVGPAAPMPPLSAEPPTIQPEVLDPLGSHETGTPQALPPVSATGPLAQQPPGDAPARVPPVADRPPRREGSDAPPLASGPDQPVAGPREPGPELSLAPPPAAAVPAMSQPGAAGQAQGAEATPAGQVLETIARQAFPLEPAAAPPGPPPRVEEPAIPQVRIGQINVLIEDQAAARPRAKVVPAAPAAANPFGLRGL